MSTDTTWFRSLHYGGTHVCLWWLVRPNDTLHVAAELVKPSGLISALCIAIKQQTKALKIPSVRYTIADKAAMVGTTKPGDDGETRLDTFRANGILIRESTHDPLQGWTRVKELLGLRPDGRPWLTIDPACVVLIRALTNAVTDPKDAESILDASPPLHALRLGAMSRPAPQPFKAPPLSKNAVGHLVNEIRTGGTRSSLSWR